MNTETIHQPTITFLNSSGDITIGWEKDNEEHVLALIETKMKEGYTFFVLKPRLGGLLGNAKKPVISIDQVRKAGSVIAPDALAKAVSLNLGDAAVSAVVSSGHATLVSMAKVVSLDSVRRAANALEVIRSQTVAIRPLQGG
jgi:hypothetical protein